jgi:hypothetical protein
MTNVLDFAPTALPGSAADWRLIEEFCADLLCENVQSHVRAGLAGILLEGLAENLEAVISWGLISREMSAPLRARREGEPLGQRQLERLQAIEDLCADFWRNHARGARPRYPRGTEQ